MSEYLLVGVMHEDSASDRYLSREREEAFQEKILPRITRETTVFHEGRWDDSPLRPGSPGHEKSRRRYLPCCTDEERSPTIVGSDVRALRFKTNASYEAMLAEMVQLIAWCDEHVVLTGPVPLSTPALIEQSRVPAKFRLTNPPGFRLRNIARELWLMNGRVNDALEKRMRDEKIGGSFRILLAGESHAIALHKTTGWPVELLESGATESTEGWNVRYRATLLLTEFARAIATHR